MTSLCLVKSFTDTNDEILAGNTKDKKSIESAGLYTGASFQKVKKSCQTVVKVYVFLN